MIQTQCRHFNGYKPCAVAGVSACNEACAKKDLIQNSILIVHLGALGAVVRATSLLSAIKMKYPSSHLTWVTDAPADRLLAGHPGIDRVLTSGAEDILKLAALSFDFAFVIDKSLKAVGILKQTQVKISFGFTADSKNGAIVPASKAATELWELGLSNGQKFFVNNKSEVQLMLEALELMPIQSVRLSIDEIRRFEYQMPLNPSEENEAFARNQTWSRNLVQPVIGLNTGCSAVIPYKKLSVQYHRDLILRLKEKGFKNIVLLGGPEDTERNRQISMGLDVVNSNTEGGLRDGLVSVAACDLVITGDSLGMHMAISQKKYVVAWFGPTCSQEIEFFGRGESVLTKAGCAPCWKRTCDKSQMCYDQVEVQELLQSLNKGYQLWLEKKSSLFKLPFSEMSY